MDLPELLRTPTFRLAAVAAAVFVFCVLILFTFVYWQTALSETSGIDRFLRREVAVIAKSDAEAMVRSLSRPGGLARRHGGYAALFGPDGEPLVGNLRSYPAGLPIDGRSHSVEIAGASGRGIVVERARAAAARLPDGRLVVIARGMSDLDELDEVVLRALALGVIPASALALAGGALLSWRALRRVRMVHRAAERILLGNLHERLPARGTPDDFDRLAAAVNGMLDEIERLIEAIKGIGGNIAHDLRTPLTRVRMRLERGRDAAHSKEELEAAVSGALAGLDQALAIVTALLRITELEDGRRRAGFRRVELAGLLREVVELYEPIAEEAGIAIRLAAPVSRLVHGDRDLLVEAVANVVDNAIKFAPPQGRVEVGLTERAGRPVIRVADDGAGIPPEEREAVLRRFYRSEKTRHLPGNGLGLGLVSAIVKLHKFHVIIDDAAPGCIFEIVCADAPAPIAEAAVRPRPALRPARQA